MSRQESFPPTAAPAQTLRAWLLLLLFLLCWQALPAAAGEEPGKQVVFIRYPIGPNHFRGQMQAFRETMARLGFSEGEKIRYIDVLTKSAGEESAPEVVAAVERYKASTDLFVTCGWVSMVARPLLKESGIPQLFVPVLESVALSMLPSLTRAPETNLSGIYLMYPPEKVLRLAKLVIPGLRHYAYVYDSRIPADASYLAAYQRLPPEARYGITLHFLDLSGGAAPVLAQLRQQKVEAFGGIVGATQHRAALLESGLPQITSYTLDIEPGEIAAFTKGGNTVAGLFNSFPSCGEQAARMAADILSGRTAIAAMPPQPARQLTFVDLRNARRLALKVPFGAVEAVDLVIK